MSLLTKTVSILICCALVLGLFSACSNSGGDDVSISDTNTVQVMQESDAFDAPVFERAREYGFVPDEMWDRPNETITMSDFCVLLSNVVESFDSDCLPYWNELSAVAASDFSEIQVDDAILAIFEAAIAMDIFWHDGICDDTNWESVSTLPDWWEGASWDYSCFPNWEDAYVSEHGSEEEILLGAVLYCQKHISIVDGSYIFPPNENWTFDFAKDVTYQEAIRAITVFMESDAQILAEEPEYVSVYDVGDFDSSIITEDLLDKDTLLPDVTQSSLPSSWRGVGLASRKDAARSYRDFRESDIRVLSDNNMNFTRVFFDFTKLQFPYTSEDREMVNLNELRELDQLIAWGMEYDVHIQIGCFGFLGYNCQGVKEFNQLSDEEWELFGEFWKMLARRYAGIPSSYLSFDLLNEWTPDDESQYIHYADIFGNIADGIWDIDENRVVVNSFRSNPDQKWVELIAAEGIALGIHPYNPAYITMWERNVEYPADPTWPNPWFGCIMEAGDTINISGEIAGGELAIYLEGATQDAILNVYSDGNLIESIDPVSDVIDEYGDYREFDLPYTIQIPENCEILSLQSTNGSRWIRFNGLQFESNGQTLGIMPHDYEYFTDRANVNLAVDLQGWSNSDGLVYDAETVYQTEIKPYADIAEKYQVGIVINELGLFGDMDIGEVAYAYVDDMLKTLNAHGLGWCYCEMEIGYLFDSTGVANFVLKNSPVSQVVYEYEDGRSEFFWVCDDMISVLRKYAA